ncbi:hypothetical protein [Sulfuricurvum sp.]|uniref:hypothetical protein n=1 Tax=Sulfuricurvum sp. TaxID=2025608 RepID=UPI002D36EBAF|nr:hypothetical protein [Sulfuricurvum sp.]HZF69839.1 hypothetical protein [Sulfuricurvum sp.]
MNASKALEILEDLKHVLFQDFTKWRGYSRRDFSKAIEELEVLEASKSCVWISTDDEMPKAGQIVFAYMENNVELAEKVFEFHDVIRAVYYPKFHMECNGDFDGDVDYDEEKDEYYWPEGWYEWNAVEDTHWLATKKAKLWMHIPVPKAKS